MQRCAMRSVAWRQQIHDVRERRFAAIGAGAITFDHIDIEGEPVALELRHVQRPPAWLESKLPGLGVPVRSSEKRSRSSAP